MTEIIITDTILFIIMAMTCAISIFVFTILQRFFTKKTIEKAILQQAKRKR